MLTHLKNLCTVALLSTLTLCGWQLYRVLEQVEQRAREAESVLARADATLTDARRVLLSVGGTAAQVRKASEEQRVLFAETTKRTNQLLADASATVKRLDEQVNGMLLPAATTAIRENSAMSQQTMRESVWAIRQASSDLHAVSEELNPVLQNTASTVASLDALANNENIPRTMAHTEKTMEHVSGIASNVEKATKPAKMWLRGLQWAWDNVVKGFIVF